MFAATNSVGVSSQKAVHVYVGPGTPELTALRNAAGPAAPAACTPGSAATLTGRFLFDGQASKVTVNGIERPVLLASPERIDFLCSEDAPGTQLQISLRNGTGTSNTWQTTMLADAPGILTVDAAGTGQALAFRPGASELAALPESAISGQPGGCRRAAHRGRVRYFLR